MYRADSLGAECIGEMVADDIPGGASGESDSHQWAGRGSGREPGDNHSRASARSRARFCSWKQHGSRGDLLHGHAGIDPAGAQDRARGEARGGDARAPEGGPAAAGRPLLGNGSGTSRPGCDRGGGREFSAGQHQRRQQPRQPGHQLQPQVRTARSGIVQGQRLRARGGQLRLPHLRHGREVGARAVQHQRPLQRGWEGIH
jgi:hypothetical protein